MNKKAYAKIQQRRLQMLVHSYLYYILDENIISDHTWNKWAHELVRLQKKFPKTSKKVPYYKQFKDWDGSTGAFLDFDDNIAGKAEYLLAMRQPKELIKKFTKPKVKKLPVKSKTKKRKLF